MKSSISNQNNTTQQQNQANTYSKAIKESKKHLSLTTKKAHLFVHKMQEEEDTSPPFWLQNTTAGSRHLRRSYSMFLNSSAVLIFILVAALALILIIVPTLHSFTSHILKPQSVKKSWDSLNLVLVLFAIFCGFLSRNTPTNETPRSYQNQTFTETRQESEKQNPETSIHWYEYSDRTEYNRPYNRLRSISSYPDLRQDSPWLDPEERWRFYDDTHVNRYRQHRRQEEEDERRVITKNIEVDTFEVRTKEVPSALPVPVEKQQSPPPPPPSPPPPPQRPRRKDHARKDGMIEKQRNSDLGGETLKPRNSMPPPPPPPPANKSKRGSATKEFLTSFKGRKKRQRKRSVENLESMLLNSEPPTTLPSRQPPPPPPPPPPPSVFHSLFSSKKSKHKKGHYDPRPSQHVSSLKTKPHAVANANLNKSHLRENFYRSEDNVVTGNESPLMPIPPPPPPPPFKLPAWKFKVQDGFVRVNSIGSSSSERSPELDEVEDSPTSEAAANGGEPEILLFYPSPNVDTKAGTFIENFRAGLRLEKINSTREKQGIGMSNLGPSLYSQKTGSNRLKINN